MLPVLPLYGGHGVRGFEAAALPLFGGFTLLLLLLAGLAALYLWRSGRLAVPALGRSGLPEQEAQRILAKRFARGDISRRMLERGQHAQLDTGRRHGC